MKIKNPCIDLVLKILFSAILLLPVDMFAQSIYKSIHAYPWLQQRQCPIVFPGKDSTVWDGFFEKLDRLITTGEGRVTILHIGGSHIQAGTFSGRTRNNLLQIFPGLIGSRGLVFPFSAAETNNPYNYKTTSVGAWEMCKNSQRDPKFIMGLSGICVATTDPKAEIAIQMRNTDALAFDFKTVWLLGYSVDSTVKPVLKINKIENLEGVYDADKLAYRFDLQEYTDSFRLAFVLTDSMKAPFIVRGFWLDNDLDGLSYVDVGVNGANVSSYLKCVELERDLAFVNPDLCIFSIGINDANGREFDTVNFQNNYKKLIQRIGSVSPRCAILFTTNNDSYTKAGGYVAINNANGLLAQRSFYALAKHYHAGVWDLFDFMGGLTSMQKWAEEGLGQKDKVHFTSEGYTLLGDVFYNSLICQYVQYLKRRCKP